MRPPQRKRRLQFEVMESREVLSASLAGASLASPVLVSLPSIPIPPPHEPPVQLVVLQGLLSGSYSAHTFPDVGTTYDLSGKGQVRPFGPMDVTGTLHSLGFIQQGHAGGTLTLSDSQGTLTLQLTGPLQRGFSPLPNQFAFEITGGTGAFANATGGGTAFLQLVADPIDVLDGPAATPNLLVQAGNFDLDLVGSYSLQPPKSQT